jgi:DNA-binding beta-propeller fold protein YncE
MTLKYCTLLLMTVVVTLRLQAQAAAPLSPAPSLEMPSDVKGNFDHLAIDLKGHRLFVTPEEHKSVIVFDYSTGKVVHAIQGIGVPHAVLYREDRDRIFVTDGEPGEVKIFDGRTYALRKTIKLLAHTDSIAYDHATKHLYIITGGKQAKQQISKIVAIDTTSESVVAEIEVEGDALEAMAIEPGSNRLYVNNTSKNRIDVIDRETRRLTTSWPITLGQNNTSLTLDEANHRLFVGCRSGAFVVLDTITGKEVTSLPMTKGVDDMIYDPSTKRIYASCGDGSGFIEVYKEEDPNQFEQIAHVPSGPKGKTSLLSLPLHRYFVSVPQHANANAAVLVYQVD